MKKRKMIKKVRIRKIVRKIRRINHNGSRKVNTYMTRMGTKLKIVIENIMVGIPSISTNII